MTEKPRQISRYLLMLAVAVSAVVLLSLSWPRLQASIRFLPVDTALSNYRDSGAIEPAQVDALVARAEAAIALHDHYRYWDGLSELQILSGQDVSKPYWQRRQILQRSVASAEEVVRRAPAKPRTWLRIARLREVLGSPQADIIPAWKMSVLTGRVEPTLMLVRLQLGTRYFAALDEESLALLRDQAVLTWDVQNKQMREALESGSLELELIRELLSSDYPEIIAELEAK